MKPTALFAAALLLASALPAAADTSLTAYEASRQALLAIWAELPLTVRNVALTDGPPAGYGDYKAHQGNSFKAGETIEIYAEVLGYGFKDNGDGTFSKLLDADLALVDDTGTTVARKDKFLTTAQTSREKILESDLAFNVTLSAFAPGPYKLQFSVHDEVSGKATSFDVPITLVGDDASSPDEPTPSSAAPDTAPSSFSSVSAASQ